MKMHIKINPKNCHTRVRILKDGFKLLDLDNGEKTVELYAGISYQFQWFVIAGQNASVKAEARMEPANTGFPDWVIDKKSGSAPGDLPPAGQSDVLVFSFTLTP